MAWMSEDNFKAWCKAAMINKWKNVSHTNHEDKIAIGTPDTSSITPFGTIWTEYKFENGILRPSQYGWLVSRWEIHHSSFLLWGFKSRVVGLYTGQDLIDFGPDLRKVEARYHCMAEDFDLHLQTIEDFVTGSHDDYRAQSISPGLRSLARD